ncbi:MAG: invasion associated locus B family protein [Pseudoruegeria sp.]
MAKILKVLGLAALCAAPTALLAQETTAAEDTQAPAAQPETTDGVPTGANQLSLGEEINAGPKIGDTYIREKFGDWELRCVKSEGDLDPCQLYQLMLDQKGNSVAEVNMFGLTGQGQAAAGATIITPLETLLTQQLTLTVDSGAAKRYPFTWCAQLGCVARVGFTQSEVDGFKRGAAAKVVIVPVAAPDQQVILTLSLSGFTAAFDAVNASNQAVAEAARAAAEASE